MSPCSLCFIRDDDGNEEERRRTPRDMLHIAGLKDMVV